MVVGEVVDGSIFPTLLKLADIVPVHKKLTKAYKKNYRPVSILPIVSKIFERLMHQQINSFVSNLLSKFLCGYRKNYNSQYALLFMIEKWKAMLDKGGFAGAVLMDLSKAFDTINHELLIAKLRAYGFSFKALKLVLHYLCGRHQRVKINLSFSSWVELLLGVPQGSVLGPLLFNIYLNDLFYILKDVCNFADDTSPFSCDVELTEVLEKLEIDSAEALKWFELNFMKLNADKCHLLLCGNKGTIKSVKVGSETILQSEEEKLLGVLIDSDLKFGKHLKALCKKVGIKITLLCKVAGFLEFMQKKLLFQIFIESQFSYCPLVWMFCSRKMNRRINALHERALRIVYNDYASSFDELLKIDKSLTIHQKNIHKVAIEMFKVKNGTCPEFIKDIFEKYEGPSTRLDRNYYWPNANKVFKGEMSFRIFGPIVWDEMLPNAYKNYGSVEEFKNGIKDWVPDNCRCRLCKEYEPGIGFVSTFE